MSGTEAQARASAAGSTAPRQPGRFQQLQALEDANRYRPARAAEPCADCAAARELATAPRGHEAEEAGQ